MDLISKTFQHCKQEIYTIEKDGEEFELIWYVSTNTIIQNVIDSELRNGKGESIFDDELLEEIERFIVSNDFHLKTKP
jgi:hypothetical protein